jgi:penicillin amidase
VTSANDPFFSQPVVGASPLYLGFDYDPGTRVGRMTKRINAAVTAGHKFTLDDVSSIQSDTISEWGQAMAPTFIQTASDLAAEIATPGTNPSLTSIATGADATARGLVQQAHDIMAAWTDFDTPSGLENETSTQQLADSKAALLDSVFYSNFAHLTFDDEIAALGVSPLDTNLRKLLIQMCTDPSVLATGLSSAAQAIINTLDYVVTTLGSDPSKWAWGTVHTLTLDFLLPIGSLNLPVQGDTTYPNGYPRHGDEGTVDVGDYGLSLTDFTYDQGPAIRFGADLAKTGISAQNVLPGGQTFNPTSPHYQDQLALWLKNQTFPLAQTTAAVLASAQVEYAANHDGRVQFVP